MSTQSELLAEIEAFLPKRGIKDTTFGFLAVNDGKFVQRLRDEANITLATVDKAREYIRRETAALARTEAVV